MFAVSKGQTLRVIVHAWSEEQSLRAGKNTIKLATKEIKCK
jgi:hypothetical protein